MSELSFSNISNNRNKNEFFSMFFHFCFSIFSHPLYLSYFLFFSPYLIKLLSFLSPLFITTTLLLLVALLTFTPNLVHEKGVVVVGSELLPTESSKWGFFLSVLQTFLAWVVSESDDKDEEIGFLDELEAYLVMFQASIFEALEPKSLEDCSEEGFEAEDFAECSSSPVVEEEPKVIINLDDESPVEKVDKVEDFDENPVEKVDHKVEPTRPVVVVAEVKSLESLFQENAELEEEDVSCQKEDKVKEVKTLDAAAESNKVEEESKGNCPIMRNGSKVMLGSSRDMYRNNKVRGINSDGPQRVLEGNFGSPQSNWGYNSQELCSSNLGSFGSMRVEKEWRRTLACKLFEERHNADGSSEGMDMLWETYETESNNSKGLQKSNTKKGKIKKSEVVEYGEEDEDEEEEEEEEEEMEGKLCCLQALKFSTGKMNLGMGRPNLLKFSKAFKGIGWLHHAVGRHGRKNHNH